MALVAALLAGPAAADRSDDMSALMDALRIRDTVEIMREEGVLYGDDLAEEMLSGTESKSWRAVVSRIYDTEKMYASVERGFEEELADADLAPMLDFFRSDLGREIVDLELSAREAFIDPDTEDAARGRYDEARNNDTRLARQIETMIDDGDLVEFNVTGALNSNLMFYRGLSDGGAFEMTEEEILADVWAQEGEVREDTVSWMGAFLLMAYTPLEPEEVDAYISFYRTPSGRELNRAMFGAFDGMYEDISYLLGQTVASHMQSQEL